MIDCQKCATSNPEGAAFCMGCGAPLVLVCASCGAEAPAGARFCSACGSPLGLAAPADPVAEPSGGDAHEERRTVTVLFADISGFTAMAETLDHETVKRLMERCLTRLGAEVERFGGHVDKYIGDNVMALFGAPVAHEDDPDRAVRAAFAMQGAMEELNREFSPRFGVQLALRVGVNTGEVLAGRIGQGYTVLGDAVNVAARLESAAPVGGILVGERTQRMSSRAISYSEVPALQLKGKREPVPAWEAVEVRKAGRAEPGQSPSTPLIGREEELTLLETTFQRVQRDGASHMVTMIGQAGVGKSRLLQEFERTLDGRRAPVRVRRGRCLAFGSGGVYWPLVEIMRAECGIGEADEPAVVRSKLTARLGPALIALEGEDQVERRIAPLARLLGADDATEPSADEPEEQQSAREAFFGAVRAVLEALSHEHVTVLVWEDIHWADEGTLDLIVYLSRWLRAPVLQLCLARDDLLERRPEWSTVRRTVTAAFLEPLAPTHTRQLIDALLLSSGAATELAETLVERSGGNPLFAEAIVQHIAEDGGASASNLPDTVQGLLAARLDSLEPFERQLVLHAAVLGRTFWESALEPLASAAGEPLEPALAALREKDILLPGEAAHLDGERELAFKHVLIRDAAYELLPKSARARKHAEVGAFIEQRSGNQRGEGTVA
ncbi:MAG: adenylate/guanylate cyclase domain-containing protein, partial [Solirubrobacteraceae bacterium]